MRGARAASIVGWLAVWLAFTVSTLILGLVLGLLAPRAAAAVDAAARDIGPVILWGLVLLIGLPIVAILAMVTLVGLPLGVGLLFALGLIYGIGYTAGAWILGRRVASRASPILAFLAGWGILRILALIPFLGGLVGLAAVVVGLGAIVMAGNRAAAATSSPRSRVDRCRHPQRLRVRPSRAMAFCAAHRASGVHSARAIGAGRVGSTLVQ